MNTFMSEDAPLKMPVVEPPYLVLIVPVYTFSVNHSVTLQLMRKSCSYTYPALSIARYSYTQRC